MTNVVLVESGVAVLVVGALVGLALSRSRVLCGWVSTLFVTAAAIPLGTVVVRVFAGGVEPEVLVLDAGVLGSSLAVTIDPLSALFLSILIVLGVLSTMFSVRYMEKFEGDSVAKFYPVLLLFFASIVGVLVTSDFLFFLVFWELMTLTSFFLVTFERADPASQRAGLKYFVITHGATLCMIAAALILWRESGSLRFSAMRDALGVLLVGDPVAYHLVILLFFVGFATKAGVLPMGAWLPDAHPVAPSGMSAVLSGVLVKVGIYALLRLFLSLIPAAAAMEVWGILLALAGAGSLFIGTLTALKQVDTKRLMAFHTIGQIGYICLGLGVGVYCLPHQPGLAALALMGAVFHAVNHACFKACLFLGAGSVLYRTGERNMDKLGGLGAFMPATAASSTVASLSIAGVPPLNGFASKWLILATCLLVGFQTPLFLVLGILGLFVSLATLASFLKVLGSVFLGWADERRRISEVPASMVVPQLVLASLCVLLGVFPEAPLRIIHESVATAAQTALPAYDAVLGGSQALNLMVGQSGLAGWAPLTMLAVLVVLVLVAYGIQRAGGAEVRNVPVWTCGEEHDPDTVRYPASSLYLPFKHAFERIYPSFKVSVPGFPAFLRRAFDIDAWLYDPLVRMLDRAAAGMTRTHVGTPQMYLLWIVVGAIVVVAIMLTVMVG